MTRVKALTSFVSTLNGKKYRVRAGDELDLPDGADWVGAGLVGAVGGDIATAEPDAPTTPNDALAEEPVAKGKKKA